MFLVFASALLRSDDKRVMFFVKRTRDLCSCGSLISLFWPLRQAGILEQLLQERRILRYGIYNGIRGLAVRDVRIVVACRASVGRFLAMWCRAHHRRRHLHYAGVRYRQRHFRNSCELQ